jgi:hypothetical protein
MDYSVRKYLPSQMPLCRVRGSDYLQVIFIPVEEIILFKEVIPGSLPKENLFGYLRTAFEFLDFNLLGGCSDVVC